STLADTDLLTGRTEPFYEPIAFKDVSFLSFSKGRSMSRFAVKKVQNSLIGAFYEPVFGENGSKWSHRKERSMSRFGVKNVQNRLIGAFYEPVFGENGSKRSHRAVL